MKFLYRGTEHRDQKFELLPVFQQECSDTNVSLHSLLILQRVIDVSPQQTFAPSTALGSMLLPVPDSDLPRPGSDHAVARLIGLQAWRCHPMDDPTFLSSKQMLRTRATTRGSGGSQSRSRGGSLDGQETHTHTHIHSLAGRARKAGAEAASSELELADSLLLLTNLLSSVLLHAHAVPCSR